MECVLILSVIETDGTNLKETEEVYLLTPSCWNPHCYSYAQNEENMLDWEGNMVERKDKMQILIDDLPDGAKTVGSTQISSVESARIDAIVEARGPRCARKSKLHTALSLSKRMKCLRFCLEYRPTWLMLNYWITYQHAAIFPMRTKSEVLQAVKQFAKEIRAPDAIICDMSREQTSRSLRKFCGEIGTTLHVLEEGTPWANKAELYIRLIKEAVRKDMKDSNCPLAFWDYCAERRARINNMTAKDTFNLHGSNPNTVLTGDEGDISSLCQFGWYEWCYYRDHTEKFPLNKEVLGWILGPAKGEGNEMAQWVLKANGNVVPQCTARPLTVAETHSTTELKKRGTFDALVEKQWGTSMSPPPVPKDDAKSVFNEYEDDDEDK